MWEWFSVCLADVEDADVPVASQHLHFGVFVVFAEHGCEYADASLTLTDLPAKLLPLPVTSDGSGCGALAVDEQAVQEAVRVELSAELQRVDPAVTGEQVEYGGLQALQGSLVWGLGFRAGNGFLPNGKSPTLRLESRAHRSFLLIAVCDCREAAAKPESTVEQAPTPKLIQLRQGDAGGASFPGPGFPVG